jgi:hypothetical protein
MEECVSLAGGHIFVEAFGEIVSPGTILMAHPLVIHVVLLLALLEQSSCKILVARNTLNEGRALTGCDFLILQVDKFLESKDNYIRRVDWGAQQFPEEVGVLFVVS